MQTSSSSSIRPITNDATRLTDSIESSSSSVPMQIPVSSASSSPVCLDLHEKLRCPRTAISGADIESSIGKSLTRPCCSGTQIETESANDTRIREGSADQNDMAAIFREASEQPTYERDAEAGVRSSMQALEIEEGPCHAASALPQAVLRDALRIRSSMQRAMLGNAVRIGISTVAGRTASWALQECLPEHLGLAAYGISGIGTTIRGMAAIDLGQRAAQTFESRPLRGLAITGGVLGGAAMMLPVGMLLHSPTDNLANTVAMQSIADFTYTAIRDPLESVLRDTGPRIFLPPPANWNHPDLRALAFAGGVYALSAIGWLSLFKDHVSPAGCGDGPSCSALSTIAPPLAVEASEAVAMAFISSLARRAVFRDDVSLRLPQPGATYVHACMRIFATGIMRLLDIWRQQPSGPSGIVYAVLLAVMMFALELLNGMTQRVIARSTADHAEQSDDEMSQVSIEEIE